MRYAREKGTITGFRGPVFRSTLLAVLILGLSPIHAQAQALETCNAKIDIYRVDGPQPFFVGDTLTLKSTIGAGEIKDNDLTGGGAGNPYIDFTGIGYGVDCGGGSMATLSDCKPQGFGEYDNPGHDIEFLGVTYSDCPTDDPDVGAIWPVPESDNIVAIPVLNGVVRQAYDPIAKAGEKCMVDVSFVVNSLHESSNWVTQALGVPFDNRTPGDAVDDMVGVCSNDLSAAGYGKAQFKVETCGIEVVKEVSIDGETWVDANSELEAPKLPSDGTAYYRLIVRNTSSVPYVGDLHVVDPILDIDTWITPAFDENGEMIIGGPDTEFELAELCADVVEDQDLFLTNEATVEGTCRASEDPGLRVFATGSDIAVVNCLAKPKDPLTAVVIQKFTNGEDADSPTGPYVPVGDTVTWSYQVTNVGEEPITIDSVTDDVQGAVSCPGDAIEPGATVSCTNLTAAAIAGQYANLATVIATGTETGNTANDSDPSHYFGLQASIELVKTPDPETYAAVDDVITYTFKVTNTSNVPLTDVYVEDPLPGLSTITCPATELAAGAFMNCTATYSITQDDMNAGQVDNTATAYGTAPNGDEVNDSDSAQVTTSRDASLSLVKTAVPTIYTAAGQQIGYTYVMTNTGNVTLYPTYSVADDKATVSCPQDDPALEPGEQVVCTATYTIQAGDVTAKSVTNVARGQAFDGNDNPVLSNEDQETVYYAALNVLKQIYDDGAWRAADDVDSAPVRYWPAGAQFRVVVQNTGAVDLENVSFTDVLLGIADEPINGGTLAVGETVTVTAGDFAVLDMETACDATENVKNTALVGATTVSGGTPVSDSDDAWLVCVGTPEITVKKYISIDGGATWVDDTAGPVDAPSGALYKITVSNTGNVKLVDVTLDDSLIGGDPFSVADLEVGASVDVTSGEWAELAMEQVCGSSGLIQNTVTASGTSGDRDSDTDTDTDSAWLDCIGPPQIAIVKEVSLDGGDNWFDANEEPFPTALYDPENPVPALYRITVYNVGDEDLTNVLVNDGTLGIVDYLVGDLAAGASAVIDSGMLEALSVDNICTSTGEKANVANATGETETGTSDQAFDSATVVCVGSPAIQVVKEVSKDGVTFFDANTAEAAVLAIAPNDAWYRITLTNIGNETLENVSVTDAFLGITDFYPDLGPDGVLTPGETVVLRHENPADPLNQLDALYLPEICTTGGDPMQNIAIVNADSSESPATPSDEDSAWFVCEEPVDICMDDNGNVLGTPTTLKMEYNGTWQSDNAQNAEGIFVNGYTSGDWGLVTTVNVAGVSGSKVGDGVDIPAILGQDIVIDGTFRVQNAADKIPPTIQLEFRTVSGEAVQYIRFHGSCSLPLYIGDQYSGMTITGYTR